jgi:hypothetical protein
MKNDLLNNNFLVDIVHVVPIAEYIVCSCIFLLLNLEKYARSMIFFFLFLESNFRIFEWSTSPFKPLKRTSWYDMVREVWASRYRIRKYVSHF